MKLFNNHLKAKNISTQDIKIIAGLYNFDINRIVRLIKSTEIGDASYSYVDIVTNPKIVSIVKSITNLPIFVSYIYPYRSL